MRRVLPYLAVLLAIGVVVYAHGLRTLDKRELSAAVTRLPKVPLNIGPWRGEAQMIDPRELVVGEIDGSLLRRYVHQDGTALTFLVVCGRPGPISVHTPDICYTGAGYVLKQEATRHVVSAAPSGEFWVGDFDNVSPVPKPPLRIFWSWNAGDGWQAPDRPRLTFAPKPYLYKAYVVRDMNQTNAPPIESDPSVEFLRMMLPVLETTLTPKTAVSSSDGRA